VYIIKKINTERLYHGISFICNYLSAYGIFRLTVHQVNLFKFMLFYVVLDFNKMVVDKLVERIASFYEPDQFNLEKAYAEMCILNSVFVLSMYYFI
jgi:hypothetical protein